jgi:hypothetical protein
VRLGEGLVDRERARGRRFALGVRFMRALVVVVAENIVRVGEAGVRERVARVEVDRFLKMAEWFRSPSTVRLFQW